MEASALPVPQGLARTRLTIGAPLLRLRSDEQLVALFRSGNNEAFRVIHDRYRQRLFAYTRQMLPGSRQDAEDALQDVFVRAFGGLRANDRELALRAWLYRIAHNRCIDELRRPAPPAPEVMELVRPPVSDPIEEAEQRESLRRLIEDVRRLPEQQRSALLMRELGGMSYNELAGALAVSVPAVKSLLVRARVGLAHAFEARETSCVEIREDLIVAHDRGVRPTGMARRHMHDCEGCREFRGRLRGTSRQFAALVPALGPAGVLAKLLGFGGGASGGAAAGGGAGGSAAAGGVVAAGGLLGTGGAAASFGVIATGAGHVATLLAAAVVAAGGAVEVQHSLAPAHHPHHRAAPTAKAPASSAAVVPSPASIAPPPATVRVAAVPAAPPAPVTPAASRVPEKAPAPAVHHHRHHATDAGTPLPPKPILNLTGPYGDGSGPTGPGSDRGTATSTGGTGSTTGSTSTGTPGTTGTDPGQTGTTGTGSGASGPGTSTGGGTPGSVGPGTTPTGDTGTGSGTPSTVPSGGEGTSSGSSPSSSGSTGPTSTS